MTERRKTAAWFRSWIGGVLLLLLTIPAPARASLNLTPAERAWLAEHPTIRLAVDTGWPPFEWVDENKVYQGMAAAYMNLVQELLGVTFAIDKDRPWSQMVEGVKNRELDAFSCVVETDARKQFALFTKPYISFPMVILTRESEHFVDGVNDLRGKKVAVVKSYASHDLLVQNHPELNLLLAQNVREGLEAVSQGQAYAFIGNLAVAGHVIREHGITNVKVSGQTPYRFQLAMAVRKDWPELVSILQKALDSITPREQDAIFNQWIRVKYQQEVDYRIVGGVAVGALLLLLFILAWNRRLKQEVLRREREALHRVQAEIKLRDQVARHQAILDTAVEGIITIDEKGTMQSVNPAAARLFGYTIDEMAGRNVKMITPSPVHEEHDGYLSRYLKTGEKTIIGMPREVEGIKKNGAPIPVSLAVSEILLEDRRLFTGILHDLTEQKKAERTKNEFVSMVSHELRTPLTAISGGLKLVHSGVTGELPEKAGAMVEMAYRNSERLNLLINDILDLQKIEAGRMTFQFTALDLASLAEKAINENQAFAHKHNARLVLENRLSGALFVRGDASRLAQVMANLLSNAAKFSPEGGEVTVILEESEGAAQVTVKDRGPGIPESFHDSIFEKFAQADASSTREKGGTGLGLSITKAMVESHGGKIGFTSESGRGASFWFRLPQITPPTS